MPNPSNKGTLKEFNHNDAAFKNNTYSIKNIGFGIYLIPRTGQPTYVCSNTLELYWSSKKLGTSSRHV